MTSSRITTSRPPDCVFPRPHTDESHRRRTYGPVQGMDYDEESFAERFSRRFAYFVIGLASVPTAYHFALAMGWLS